MLHTKRILSKLLALLLLLPVLQGALCATTLAYTGNDASGGQEAMPFNYTGVKLGLYLVEYSSTNADAPALNALSGWLSLPPSNRGYAKNEVVAAIGVLTVDANRSMAYDENLLRTSLAFTPTNMSLQVPENNLISVTSNADLYALPTTNMPSTWVNRWTIFTLHGREIDAPLEYSFQFNRLPVEPVEKTYRFLVFARVLDEGAKLSFSLKRGHRLNSSVYGIGTPGNWRPYSAGWPAELLEYTPGPLSHHNYTVSECPEDTIVLDEEYLVLVRGKSTNYYNSPMYYYITRNTDRGLNFKLDNNDLPGPVLFAIVEGKHNFTQRMYLFPEENAGPIYRVHIDPSRETPMFIYIGGGAAKGMVVGDQVKYGTAQYSKLLAFYEEFVVEKFGLNVYNEGNQMSPQFWEDLAEEWWGNLVTVEINPVPYVSVPDNIVTMPE